ncbi:STM4015 family protein [Streptomyces sp. NPDC047928]|uniref:STM4015 family protein n=1 Tax=unclassified Streptomyces TaxID=2593676 RepID=UPI00371725BE
MSSASHLRELYGLPVFDFPRAEDLDKAKAKDKSKAEGGDASFPAPDSVAWRISVESYDSEESWEQAFARFGATVDTTRVRAIVVGAWSDPYENGPDPVLEALIGARGRLPALRALFLGDMEYDECEISWIIQGNVGRLLEGFPELEEFGVRGGTDLVFPTVRHSRLRSLTVETGGMPAEAVRGIAASDLPALERLDLWLGTSDYGGDCEIGDLAPFFAGTRLPALRRLALRNSEIQDEIATAMAAAPVVARLETLDLSMGVLTDEGATALLGGQPLTHLKKLDLHHNYLSAPLKARFRDILEPAGVSLELDQDDAEEHEDTGSGRVWRYVAVGE